MHMVIKTRYKSAGSSGDAVEVFKEAWLVTRFEELQRGVRTKISEVQRQSRSPW